MIKIIFFFTKKIANSLREGVREKITVRRREIAG